MKTGAAPETSAAAPQTWASVEETFISRTTLYYRLGAPVPINEKRGRPRRDARGRVALEAFMALPLETMYDRLGAVLDSSAARGVVPEQAALRAALAELIAFIDVFGPLGLATSRVELVENPEADRLAEENWRLELDARGFDAKALRWVRQSLWGLTPRMPGLNQLPRVEKIHGDPELPWVERVNRADQLLPQDFLGVRDGGPLSIALDDLRRSLALTQALATGNGLATRDALKGFPRFPAVFVGEDEGGASPLLDWRVAMKMRPRADGWFAPFKEHPTHVDWIELGWLVLADHLAIELESARIRVGLAGHQLRLGWQPGSLLEVIYLQLLDHIQRRPDFGIGTCDYCSAPILRVRRDQRWHSGCAPAGRQREARAARKDRLLGPAQESGR
jgi:hypothetical protein